MILDMHQSKFLYYHRKSVALPLGYIPLYHNFIKKSSYLILTFLIFPQFSQYKRKIVFSQPNSQETLILFKIDHLCLQNIFILLLIYYIIILLKIMIYSVEIRLNNKFNPDSTTRRFSTCYPSALKGD